MTTVSLRSSLARVLSVTLPLFVLVEVNRPLLAPQSQLAVFAALGLALAFLRRPPAETSSAAGDAAAIVLALTSLALGAYFVVQTEPATAAWWIDGQSLGNRAGIEGPVDLAVGVLGLLLIVVAARRVLGLALPVLALAFVAYAHWGRFLPEWLLPHRGYDWERIVSQTVLHSQGVFGIALRVMFSYVFLFVLFGALLEATGATGFIIDASQRLFRRSPGGAAKVAVLSSGLMGSLSGSAVANTATTGTFTIPMMRSAGLPAHEAAGIEAAASSGGALVPPIMGAGAYMMLEIISPPVTYLQIIRAALLPALLYYLSLFLIVHFRTRSNERPAIGADGEADETSRLGSLMRWEGVVFISALGALLGFLLQGFTVFRSVTLSLAVVLVVASLRRSTRLSPRRLLEAVVRSSESSVALIVAAACVGIVIGVVTLTGIGTRLPSLILPLAQNSLLAALGLIMVSSIVLGMGLPSAVCYLLMATLIGPALGPLGVVPLAAHLFIFYFGMMSMITPPVALAAYAASSIAGSPLLRSSTAAFRFGLVGFTLPYLFVFRPQLLMLDAEGQTAAFGDILAAVVLAVLGIAPFAAAIAGQLRRRLGTVERALLFLSAALALLPGQDRLLGILSLSVWNLAGIAIFAAVLAAQWRRPAPVPAHK